MANRATPATVDQLEAFLEALAAGFQTRAELHKDPLMPTRWQVHLASKADEKFAESLADAEIIGLEAMADELEDIADTAVDRDTAAAARVRLQARQWKLEKLMRGTYGRANEQGGEFTHYVVELPAPVDSEDEWMKRNNQQQQSEIASLSTVLNKAPKPH